MSEIYQPRLGYNEGTMEVLDIDGKTFVKSRDAAKKTGYTTDYIGQLCRKKEVNARLVGRSWYVDLDDLVQHKKDKKRSSRVKAREQVKKAIEEEKVKQTTRKVAVTNEGDVSYGDDERDLMPVISKEALHVAETDANTSVGIEMEESMDSSKVEITKNSEDDHVGVEQSGGLNPHYAHKTQVASVPQYMTKEQRIATENLPTYSHIISTKTSKGSPGVVETETKGSTQVSGGRMQRVLTLVFILIFATLGLFLEQRIEITRDSGALTASDTTYRFGIPSFRIPFK